MTQYLILGSIFVGISLVSYLLLLSVHRRLDPASQRLRNLESDSGVANARLEELVKSGATVQGFNPRLEKLLGRMDKRLQGKDKKTVQFKDLLIQAGHRSQHSAAIFMFIKITTAAVVFLLYNVLGLSGRSDQFVTIFALAVVSAAIGYRLPDIFLKFRIKKRRGEVARTLADALDMLIISVEAGLGLNSAILRVGQDMGLRSRVLGEEFLMMNRELRTGMSREKALRNFAVRNQVESLRILVGALVLADRLGTSISDTLRAQADSLRTRMQQRAEEQAAKAGVKMLLPLIFFIFPSLFIVLLGPAFLSLSKTFMEINSK